MLCFRKFLVAKKFMDKREGEASRFSYENFCLKVPKHFVGEPSVLCFSKFLVATEFMDKREGEVSRFSFEKILLHSAEKNRKGTLNGVTDFGYRKILCLRGLSHEFSANFFLSRSIENVCR